MYNVTVWHLGNQFWLRATIWTGALDRASVFADAAAAQAAIEKARKFNKAAMMKKVQIVPAPDAEALAAYVAASEA